MAKQMVKKFYGKYEAFVLPLMKFLVGLICILIINSRLGYMEQLNSFALVMIVALMCSFMPWNFMVFISAVFVLLHI